MWQRFTERARSVVFFAQEEAGRLGESFVSTEHLLLGLVREGDSVASQILMRMGIDLKEVHDEVERRVTPGEARSGQDMQLTPRAKRVIDLSYDEAKLLENNYIGTEHLLLALLSEEKGMAGRVLSDLGVCLDITRFEIRKLQEEAQKKSDPSGVVQPTVDVLKPVERRPGKSHDDNVVPDEGEREPTPGRGHIGTLRNDDERKQVEFVPNAEDLPAFTEVMTLKDEFAYRELITEAKVLLLAAGAGAKYLRMESAGIYCVRILNGDHAGKIGYILRQQLKDTRPDDRPFPPEII